MIGLRIGPSAAVRAGRMGLLLGLVVLIAAHLAGHVHGPAFTGALAQAGASSCAHLTAWESGFSPEYGHERGHEHGHGHVRDDEHKHEHHHADDHVDHAVDRPRAVLQSHAVTVHSPDASGLSRSASWLSAGDDRQYYPSTGTAFEGSRGGPRAPDGRSALALHCVWRQ
ncbi:hypothetical protein [Streptomyces albus]|uniref:hypothetical protein n=1 Tax=Streptomyces albus TaxID=1888 RepID=UPI000AB02E8F|nr:hypothetical protein [Streptomyces albus]